MQNKKYTVEIEFPRSAAIVFDHLIDLEKWWPEEFKGPSISPGAEFIFTIADSHYSKNKVIEFEPGKKFVWLTTESNRKQDGYDWTGTKMIFELIPKQSRTLLKFTYDGPVLENEVNRLEQICDFVIKESLYNFMESFTVAIGVSKTPDDVFKSITTDVAKWWGGNDLSGSSIKLDDEFIINHPGAHYSKQKVVEFIPGKKMVWLVTESTMGWLQKDKEEWTNTKMIFEIVPKGNSTMIHFTHEGLVPSKECYTLCNEGWNTVIKDYLFNYLNEGKAHFKLNSRKNSFTSSIDVDIPAGEAAKKITNVTDWWGVMFSGSAQNKGDEFVIKMGGESFFNMTVSELIPGKKIVWQVMDCYMPWYDDKKEWAGTKLIFGFAENNGKTNLTFTHEGLTPEIACYKDCQKGWTHWITNSLYSYLTTGKGNFKQS